MSPLGRLYLLFTPDLCRNDPLKTLEAAIKAGVEIVQWRSKSTNRDVFQNARKLCQHHNVPFLVNDDVMLALRSEASGAHVGQQDMPADAARKLMFGKLLGVSTHNEKQIQAAGAAYANYVGFGPCFPTTTKEYAEGVGMDAVAQAVEKCHELGIAMYAIGGITPKNLPDLYAQGVRRIAVSSYILQHENTSEAVRELLVLLP
jgi:thiamine-phosphate pyrophosphorylase